MITLKLGFVGISLATALIASTTVEPSLNQFLQQVNPMQGLDANTSVDATHDSRQSSTEATPFQYLDALNHLGSQCEGSQCDVGRLFSKAFSN